MWQVENLYLHPAMERQKAMNTDKPSGAADVSVNTDDPESFATGMDAMFPGYPREKWIDDWHALETERHAKGG